jgi:predicted ATP-dependent endonuclease of OLD family
MLKSFQIKRFRLFEHIEVKRLSRVNLVVGKNNSGKSTFLEAIELYASNVSPSVLIDLIESRQDDWFSEAQTDPYDSLKTPLRHLFFEHDLPIDEDGIVLGEIHSDTNLNIGVAAYQNKSDYEGNIRKTRVRNEELLDNEISSLENFLIVEENGKTRRVARLDEDLRDIRRKYRPFLSKKEFEFKYNWQTVPTSNIPNRKLSTLWDLTSLTDLEAEVISALHLIDNRISAVAFVEDFSRGRNESRIPLVKIKGMNEPFPLKSMGDGITRLFHIIVALVNARNGLLLIDEFENGLHWTVQPQVWDVVFQLAEKLNVQVFATTHSRDCIRGFDEAWQKYPDLGAFFRLDNKNGSIKTTEYTAETLTDAIDMDVEVR